MREATLTELHKHTSRFLDMVVAGESVRILRNGKPIADILPLPTPSWKKRGLWLFLGSLFGVTY